MKALFLILFYFGIAYSAFRQIRRDPHINAKIIWIHLAGILCCFAAIAGGVFLLIHYFGGQPVSDSQAIVLLCLMILWFSSVIIFTTVILGRLRKKVSVNRS